MKRASHPVLFAAVLAAALMPVAHLRAQQIDDIEDDIDFEEPEFNQPEYEEPEVEEPEVEEPEYAEPELEAPEVEEPELEATEADEPEYEEPEAEELEFEQPEAEQPEFEEPEAEEPEDGADDAASADFDDRGADSDTAAESSVAIATMASGDEWSTDLAGSQNPEFDDNGFPVQRGEIFALDLVDSAREALIARGFAPAEPTNLPALDAKLTTIEVPAGQSVNAALALARAIDPGGIYDFGHYYGSPYEESGQRGRASASGPDARAGTAGRLRLGLIDTQVRRASIPSRVSVTSRSFGARSTGQANDHGTAVASILVEHGAGELVVANVFADDRQGSFTSAGEIGQALDWMLENRIGVVNVSLAGPRNVILDSLVHRSVGRGLIIVAAAGNGGPAGAPAYPAALNDVIAVTAVDTSRRVYRHANRGSYIRLATYGVRVPVEMGDGTTQYFTGTSFAAPRIAARLARCIDSGDLATECIARMEQSAIDLGAPGRDNIYGYGLVE